VVSWARAGTQVIRWFPGLRLTLVRPPMLPISYSAVLRRCARIDLLIQIMLTSTLVSVGGRAWTTSLASPKAQQFSNMKFYANTSLSTLARLGARHLSFSSTATPGQAGTTTVPQALPSSWWERRRRFGDRGSTVHSLRRIPGTVNVFRLFSPTLAIMTLRCLLAT